jgi:hypothetical protein
MALILSVPAWQCQGLSPQAHPSPRKQLGIRSPNHSNLRLVTRSRCGLSLGIVQQSLARVSGSRGQRIMNRLHHRPGPGPPNLNGGLGPGQHARQAHWPPPLAGTVTTMTEVPQLAHSVAAGL